MTADQALIRDVARPRRPARRAFIATAALVGGGLAVAAGTLGYRAVRVAGTRVPAQSGESSFNAWLTIGRDGVVSVSVPHQEMGQGVHTLVALLVAEELDCDPAKISARAAPLGLAWSNPIPLLDALFLRPGQEPLASIAHRGVESLLRLTGMQMTGGSSSARNCWNAARAAAAGARALLLRVAARRWNVPADRLRTLSSRVVDPVTGLSLGFGDLADEAAQLDGRRVDPKPREQYRLAGRGIRRLDARAKSDGSARFASDIRLPGMRFASVRHAPSLGERLGSVKLPDESRAGDAGLVSGSDWFAVVASSWWLADQLAAASDAQWTSKSDARALSSDAYRQALRAAVERKAGRELSSRVDTPERPVAARKTVQADYEVPYVAHQTMEPMNCTIRLDSDSCEVWIGTQVPDLVRSAVARVVQLPTERVTVNPCLMGCGLGRRLETDVAIQAAHCALAIERGTPLQLLWRRDEDTARDPYRPASAARLEAGLGARGELVRLDCWLAGPSVLSQYLDRQLGALGRWLPDRSVDDGISDLVYDLDELRVRHERIDSPIPVGFWRSVSYGINTFFIESFIDECAHAAGDDPYQFRRRLLQRKPRQLRVLEEAARISGWGRPVQTRRGSRGGRGIAIAECYGSIVALCLEVEVEGAEIRVLRAIAAVDCGYAIDRGGVRAQIVGAIVGGLSAALHGQIDVVGGVTKQRNFDTARLLSLRETPRILVEVIDGGAQIGGIGELGLPPVAPALANALFAATAKRIRRLPLRFS